VAVRCDFPAGLARSIFSLAVAACAVCIGAAGSGQALARNRPTVGQIIHIWTADRRVVMRTLIYRPSGAGPFPLLLINHGTSSNAARRQAEDPSVFQPLAQWFVRLGYFVALPQRPGHGATGGPWLEDYGTCENPHYAVAGLAAARSIRAAMSALLRRRDVAKSGVVLVGHSAGAWGSLALASEQPRHLAAVINFAGGLGGRSYDWPNRNCAPERLIQAAARFGATSRVPTLWLYARNDTYFGPKISRAMARAYIRAGGRAEYHLLPAVGRDGHFLLATPAAAPLWHGVVRSFLRRPRGAARGQSR
jgi:pimeloyl-ACP methyl ester carboxylesterase